MSDEDYAMLRSIAAADCTPGPNFDPELLRELLDAYQALEALIHWHENDPTSLGALYAANHAREVLSRGRT